MFWEALWQSDGSGGHLHAMAFPKIDLQPRIHLWITISHTSISLQLSIELAICCSPCPCWSVVCSVAWNCRQLVPCPDDRLEGCFLDFHYTRFLTTTNQPIPCIIVIAASARMRRYKKGKLDWDSGGQSCVSISSQSAGCHLLFDGVPQFVCHTRDNRNNSLTSNLLPKPNNQLVWCGYLWDIKQYKQEDDSWQGWQQRRFRWCVIMEYLWCVILHCSLSCIVCTN
jgi:hypothetical protein